MSPVGSGAPPDTMPGPPRTRLSAADRRHQLVEVGLDLLSSRPIHELALDEVATAAGISRSLVFHYFPTKSHFYAAVVEVAAQRMLVARPPAGGTPAERVASLVTGYLRLVDRSRESYEALVRGASGGDPKVLATLDGVRASLVPRWLEAGDVASRQPATELLVRGWLAGLEEVALAWDPTQVAEDQLADLLVASFFAQVGLVRG